MHSIGNWWDVHAYAWRLSTDRHRSERHESLVPCPVNYTTDNSFRQRGKKNRSLNHILWIISAVGIATNSTGEVGLIYFRALQEAAPTYTPRAYLGDAAEAFANAAFSSIEIRLMCFIHAYKVRLSFISAVMFSIPDSHYQFLHNRIPRKKWNLSLPWSAPSYSITSVPFRVQNRRCSQRDWGLCYSRNRKATLQQ